jgi:hypothetical protein
MVATALARGIANRISNQEVDYVLTLMANQDRAGHPPFITSLANYLIRRAGTSGTGANRYC